MIRVLLLLALIVCTTAWHYNSHHHDYYAYPKYTFEYAVKDPHTKDIKKQWETRDGDKVKGSYSLVEPDGTLRIVDYQSDSHNGFTAVVRREGHAHHPHITYHGKPYGGGSGYVPAYGGFYG